MKHHCPKKWIKFFKAACDEHRQIMLAIIKKHKTLNASQIIAKMHITQPTVSHHLKILCEASLVKSEKKGKEVYYSINEKNISHCCMGFMKKLTNEKAT